ncbi:MAG: transcriptional repressor [Chlorobium sp.]|uniref:Fur family transcriptional regulator n=1 Tax=Chlorobium sp. TaxID=1095 RepID=UPI0025BC9314|nr:transcriptional repressor [Chlorobium sp.]MCF8384002.1 transcriptional repressor [Chlorobium sp.]
MITMNDVVGDADRFVAVCRDHNLKITPQRTAIYTMLRNCRDHPSADQVYRLIKKDFPNISFETVNRTLLIFASIGLISIVESTSGVRRFDPDLNSHHHMHCIRCGKIIDFQHAGYDALEVPEALYEEFPVLAKRVVLHVICPSCLQSGEEGSAGGVVA